MKKILIAGALLAGFALFAADDKLNDIKPESGKAVEAPTGAEWHNANDKKLAAETSDEALAAVVADSQSAKKLLAKVKGAYKTDPMIASKIAAVSQYVMIGADAAWYEFWRTSRSSERDIWSEALLSVAKNAKDAYVQQFCLDQLRWCGKCSQAAKVREIAASAEAREVKDFARMVARELENCPSAP
jgi:hypothetical protein